MDHPSMCIHVRLTQVSWLPSSTIDVDRFSILTSSVSEFLFLRVASLLRMYRISLSLSLMSIPSSNLFFCIHKFRWWMIMVMVLIIQWSFLTTYIQEKMCRMCHTLLFVCIQWILFFVFVSPVSINYLSNEKAVVKFMQLCICRRWPDAQLNYRLTQNVTVSSTTSFNWFRSHPEEEEKEMNELCLERILTHRSDQN